MPPSPSTSTSFKPAVRERLKLRMAVDGPSGSGKSVSALRFAMALASHYGVEIAVVDSEQDSAKKYVGETYDGQPIHFSHCSLKSYAPTEYTAKIEEAGRAGFGVIVIDGLSQAWTGKDGALEQVDKSGKNKFTDGWRTVTPQHNRMIEAILTSPAHVIVTMRSKTEYILEENEKGQKVPRKIALAPIQRQGMEYEFDLYGSMDWSHVMTVTKSRCSAVDGLIIVKPGATFMGQVIEWLDTGTIAAPIDATRLLRVDDAMLAELTAGVNRRGIKPEALKVELAKRYGVDRLSALRPEQAEDYLRKRLGGATTRSTEREPAAVEVTTSSPAQASDTEVEREVEREPGDEQPEKSDEQPTAEPQVDIRDQLQQGINHAMANNGAILEPTDRPITKARLASLRRNIGRLQKKFPGKYGDAAILKAIKKRNPAAEGPEDLTVNQCDELEAAMLAKLDPIPAVQGEGEEKPPF